MAKLLGKYFGFLILGYLIIAIGMYVAHVHFDVLLDSMWPVAIITGILFFTFQTLTIKMENKLTRTWLLGLHIFVGLTLFREYQVVPEQEDIDQAVKFFEFNYPALVIQIVAGVGTLIGIIKDVVDRIIKAVKKKEENQES